MAGSVGNSSNGYGKPPASCGIICCNCVRMRTGTTGITLFRSSENAAAGALSALLRRKVPVRQTRVFIPAWRDIDMVEITPSLAFFGLRNTAWAGHIRLKNAAGEWRLVVSSWGRIRLCEGREAEACR